MVKTYTTELLPLVLTIFNYLIYESHGLQHVTCGSVIKLQNTYHRVRLHSHDVKYGSGSGQQSVTGTDQKEDVNSHWAIRGPTNKKNCMRGEPVKCGQEVRLQHQTTLRNLHSHHFTSPLSNSQEVSAFGENGKYKRHKPKLGAYIKISHITDLNDNILFIIRRRRYWGCVESYLLWRCMAKG